MSNRPVIVLGKDKIGKPVSIDFGKTANIKIIGPTGSGKSKLLHDIISKLTSSYSPNELGIILSDEKQVEFSKYKDLPYLIRKILMKVSDELEAMKWLIGEMNSRYENPDKNPKYIFYIIDELSDLLRSDQKEEIKKNLSPLLSEGGSVGIHIIASTSFEGNLMSGSATDDFLAMAIFKPQSIQGGFSVDLWLK